MRIKNPLFVTAAAAALLLAGCSSKPSQPASEAPKAPAEAPQAAAEPPTHDPATHGTHAVVGEAQEVGPKGAHIVVKSEDGKTQRVETHAGTEVNAFEHGFQEIGKGAVQVSKATADEVKKGATVAVRYSEKEGKMVAHQVQHAAKATVKETKVIIHRVEDGGRKVIVKTKDGAEQVYEVGKDATVATGNKIVEIGKVAGAKIAEGTTATIHYTEEAGKKTIHFVEH
jgi:hypothetical protein